MLNCSGSLQTLLKIRNRVFICWPERIWRAAELTGGTCAFCALSALMTSLGISLCFAAYADRARLRIPYWLPNRRLSPTPEIPADGVLEVRRHIVRDVVYAAVFFGHEGVYLLRKFAPQAGQ